MSIATLDQEILDALRTLDCLHTSEVAEEVNRPKSTVRRHLDDLENRGLVSGTKHDERDIFDNGRIRIYWSLTDIPASELPW